LKILVAIITPKTKTPKQTTKINIVFIALPNVQSSGTAAERDVKKTI